MLDIARQTYKEVIEDAVALALDYAGTSSEASGS